MSPTWGGPNHSRNSTVRSTGGGRWTVARRPSTEATVAVASWPRTYRYTLLAAATDQTTSQTMAKRPHSRVRTVSVKYRGRGGSDEPGDAEVPASCGMTLIVAARDKRRFPSGEAGSSATRFCHDPRGRLPPDSAGSDPDYAGVAHRVCGDRRGGAS